VSKSVDTPTSPLTNWTHILLSGNNVGGRLKMPTKLKDKEKVRKLENKSNTVFHI
jgi:hypothetical protein